MGEMELIELISSSSGPAVALLALYGLKILSAVADVKVAEAKSNIQNTEAKTAEIKSTIHQLEAKAVESEANTRNITTTTNLKLVEDSALAVVEKLNQTAVEKLKSSHEDGKLTEEDVDTLNTMALELLSNTLSDELMQTVESVFGNSQLYLTNLIEKMVVESKNKKKSS